MNKVQSFRVRRTRFGKFSGSLSPPSRSDSLLISFHLKPGRSPNVRKQTTSIAAVAICSLLANAATACTGLTLKAQDGAVVFGRTLEWGSFDLYSRVVIVPRGHAFKTLTPNGNSGHAWTATYGAVGLDAARRMG